MRLRKKICLAALALLMLSQVPFIINRFRTADLDRKVRELRTRRIAQTPGRFRDYKGVVHVHSFLGGHSTGTFDELLSAAKQNELDFVVMTEHVSESFDTSAMTLTGMHDDILWLGGNEISTLEGDRFLVFRGFEGLAELGHLNTRDLLSEVHSKGQMAIAAYPERLSAQDNAIDGVEVFSLNSNARQMSAVSFLFDALWSYSSFPELTIARYIKRPDANLVEFDRISSYRRVTLTGGNDAHSSLGLHIGDDANNKYVSLKFDGYSMIFSLLRTHVLLPKEVKLNEGSLLDAIRNGNCFLGFDILGDPAGFSFFAENGSEQVILGDQAKFENGPWVLRASTPLPARLVLFRNGVKVAEALPGESMAYLPSKQGAYRIEAYLSSLGSPFDKTPWIISNPVYLR